MKKILSLLLIVALCFTLTPSTASAAVKISKAKVTLDVGKTVTLKISGTSKAVKWTSSDKDVATVSKGKVTAISSGKATITATVNKKKYKCSVTVNETEKDFADLIDYMKEEHVVSGKETKMGADMIGAISGVKYTDSGVELYEYDTTSDIYKSILDTNKVLLKDFNIELVVSAVNGKFVLFCEDAADKEDIIEMFNDFK